LSQVSNQKRSNTFGVLWRKLWAK